MLVYKQLRGLEALEKLGGVFGVSPQGHRPGKG